MNKIIQGDCLIELPKIADNFFDAIVTDSPYGLSFMGKKWDYDVPSIEIWRECLRVLKPGGFLLAFAGTRTQHRMACNIEEAGYEIRDMIAWLYGCISEDTEILTTNGWERYHKNIKSNSVLCYNINKDEFEFHIPKRSFIYDNKHTAYRIQSDYTDQIVSRNHRVLIEQCGRKVFVCAEELKTEENIPFLESLRDLPETIYDFQSHASIKKQDLLSRVHQQDIKKSTQKENTLFNRNSLSSLWKSIFNQKKQTIKVLLKTMQRQSQGYKFDSSQVRQNGDEISRNRIKWARQSSMEGWRNIFQKTWKLFAYKICQMPARIFGNGPKRRLYYGTSFNNGSIIKKMFIENRSCSSYQSQSTRQQDRESSTFSKQSRTQITRSKITPIEYSGKVWCVDVPTGAFVARRNGKIFITGNSGFPKSLNIGKAVDSLQGNEREDRLYEYPDGSVRKVRKSGSDKYAPLQGSYNETKGNSEWEGWGTALKPALEPITVARKPLSEKTVAENVLKWGTGGININECKIGVEKIKTHGGRKHVISGDNRTCPAAGMYGEHEPINTTHEGRFPANVIHDGSEEVLDAFPNTKSGKLELHHKQGDEHGDKYNYGIYGDRKAQPFESYGDEGSVARFFYCAKASKAERNIGCENLEKRNSQKMGNGLKSMVGHPSGNSGNTSTEDRQSRNNHPTVKPIALMEYLIKLVSKEGAIILDPFAGSGTTGLACQNLKRNFILMETDPYYCEIAKRRLAVFAKKEVKFNSFFEEF